MAATASPLPIPPQSSIVDNPLALALTAVAHAVPKIDPEVATAVAQGSPNVDAAVQTAQASQGFSDASNLAKQLKGENSTTQRQAWAQFPATQQAMLRSAGYKPPSTSRGLFGDIVHSVVGGAGHYLVHDTLSGLNMGQRAVTHVERTLFALGNQNPNDPQGGSWSDLLHGITSPGEWANAWDETSNGNHYILPQVKAAVQRQFGDTTYALAYKLATGTSGTQIVQSAPQASQQALATQVNSPQVQQAVTALNAGHVSVGRMLAYQALGLKAGSTAGSLLSGSTDATLDWFSDPVNVGAKAAKAWSVGKYLVRDGTDVEKLYQTNKAVQNGFADIAQHAAANDWTGLMQRYPYLAGAVDSLRAANIHTADDVANWMSDNANLRQILSGNPISLPGIEGGMLPHLTFAGQARLAAKGYLKDAVDWAADTPFRLDGLRPGDVIREAPSAPHGTDRLVTAVGKSLRKFTTLVPQGDSFNPYSQHWFNKLRDITAESLPHARANELLNQYAQEATIGGRRLIYKSILREVMAAAGGDQTPEIAHWMDEATDLDNVDSPISHAQYGPGGVDLVTRAGRQQPEPILDNQLSEQWPMPDFKTLYAQTKKLGVTRAVNGAINNRMVDAFMGRIWKPLVLGRIGFAPRVASDELLGFILRAGPKAASQARAAASALARNSDDPGDDSIVARLYDRLTSHLPETVRNNITTPVHLVAAHVGDATSRAMAGVEGRLSGAAYADTARWAAENGLLDPEGAYGKYVSAAEHGGGNFYDSELSTGKMRTKVWDHGAWVQARLKPTGAFKGYTPTDQLYTNHWYTSLRQLATSRWGRAALQSRNLSEPERIAKVAEVLKNDPNWLNASRSAATRDDRLDATVDEIAADHAKAVVDLADAITRKPDGTEVPGLVDHMLANRRPPTTAALDVIPEEDRPPSVSGPELIPVQGGLTASWSRGVNAMFHTLGKQIDWIVRQPMYLHNLTVSREAFEPMMQAWRDAGYPEDKVQAMFKDSVVDRALHLTTPYIHNPQLRSQFAVITRNVIPFWFAQEQFYKRWARNMTFAPWAFRQAQLMNQGVYHSGFTHTDPTTGQRYFMYPGVGAVQDVLTRSLGAFGLQTYLPIEANLRGEVKMASPGLERLGLPSVGPLVTVPLKAIMSLFPETGSLDPTINAQSYSQSLVPTTVSHIWQAFTSTPNNSPQFASAMMQAVRYLEATGHGIGTVATNNLGAYNGIGAPNLHGQAYSPGDYVTDAAGNRWVMQADEQWRRNDPAALAAYMDRVKNWTRIFLITRSLFGFVGPASPQNQFDPNNVNEDLQALMKELPYNEATAAFMKLHPDATAYTVFQTKNAAGDYLPATASAMGFMNANSGFFADHPLSGAFFIPTQDSSGKFDNNAYLEQLSQQLRVRRTPAEFWQEIAYQRAANVYFAAEANKNNMLNGGGANHNQIDAAWTSQSQQFMKANPLFAQQLADSGGTYTRADILQDLGNALSDPRLPETPQTEDVRTLYNAYVAYQAMTAPYGQPGSNSLSSRQRYQIEVDFANQAQAWVAQHPDALGVYQRLVAPDLSNVLNTEAVAA